LGAVIGLSGETLYFEIREQNRPVDPLAWLR
jgi:septal ring factor EnvC (AmiA/AmiB activator)